MAEGGSVVEESPVFPIEFSVRRKHVDRKDKDGEGLDSVWGMMSVMRHDRNIYDPLFAGTEILSAPPNYFELLRRESVEHEEANGLE